MVMALKFHRDFLLVSVFTAGLEVRLFVSQNS